jgi:hypothetical protein
MIDGIQDDVECFVADKIGIVDTEPSERDRMTGWLPVSKNIGIRTHSEPIRIGNVVPGNCAEIAGFPGTQLDFVPPRLISLGDRL